MNASVAVIIPVYNVEKYLAECLHSIVNQTHKNLEIIIVNDGSTDRSFDIARNIFEQDARVVLIDKINGGQSQARNVGVDYVLGNLSLEDVETNKHAGVTAEKENERQLGCRKYTVPGQRSIRQVLMHGSRHRRRPAYIQFVDSDDWIDLNAIKVSVFRAERENLDVVCFAMDFRNEDGRRELGVEHVLINHIIVPDRVICGEAIFLYLNQSWFAWVVGGVIKVDLLVQNGLRFCEGIIHEEHLWGTSLFSSAKRVRVFGDPFYHYRQRPGSTTRPIDQHGAYAISEYQYREAVEFNVGERRSTYLYHHAYSQLITALELDRSIEKLKGRHVAQEFIRTAIAQVYLPIVFGDMRALGWQDGSGEVKQGLARLTEYLGWRKRWELRWPRLWNLPRLILLRLGLLRLG